MWSDSGNILFGALLLLLGTDSLVNGVAGVAARRRGDSGSVALASAFSAALIPSLALGAAALLARQTELAIGGMVGGAIAQLGLLLGLAALLAPLRSRLKSVSWANPLLLGAIALAAALGFDQALGRVDGLILLAAFVVSAFFVLRAAAGERAAANSLHAQPPPVFGPALLALRLVAGLVLSGLGAWRLIVGALGLAADLAFNPLIIGLLVLAPAGALAGMPNASKAARQGRGDFALLQGLGGALANVLLLLGGLALWQAPALPASLGRLEFPLLFALALAIHPMMRSDGALSRREGGLLLAIYALIVIFEAWLVSA
ncbi:MAG TPA: sodium:calcium antiporter [Dokdonella sp.]|jgi:cation:H+ antiporter|nr:sodium:calcium antiporter [Dokdonella sp.]